MGSPGEGGGLEKKTNLERRPGDGLVGKLDANVVVSGLGRDVLDGAGAIAVVAASHLGLRWTLNGQSQSSSSSSYNAIPNRFKLSHHCVT